MSLIDQSHMKFEELKKEKTPSTNNERNQQVYIGEDSVPVIPGFDLTEDKHQSYVDYIKMHVIRNPFVPLGLVGVLSALMFGVRAMARGDRYQSQIMMRYRVGFQMFTIAALAAGYIISGDAMKRDKREEDDD